MTSDAKMLKVAQVVESTEAEGPGRRFAIWVQGCPLRCAGCCNPEMLPFAGGRNIEVDTLFARVLEARHRYDIEGLSFLGGEPFAHARGLAPLARLAREAKLSLMVFSGYTLEEIVEASEPAARELLDACDLLVDGRYDRALPDTSRRWVGSTNQRMHFLSDRYRADDPRFRAPNTIEIRLRGDSLTVNGWPSEARRVAPWRRP